MSSIMTTPTVYAQTIYKIIIQKELLHSVHPQILHFAVQLYKQENANKKSINN